MVSIDNLDDLHTLQNLEMWALLVGFVLPLVISALEQSTWSNGIRSAVAFVVCVIAGGITAWIAGDFDTNDIVTAALIVLTTALATYKGLWKPTGIAPKIEAATSPGTVVVDAVNTTPTAVPTEPPAPGDPPTSAGGL